MSSSTLRLGRFGRVPPTWPNYLVLVALAVFSLGPLVVLVFNSLKYDAEIRLDHSARRQSRAGTTIKRRGSTATSPPRWSTA
ncbi:MAG: hypothetical protein M5R40_24280 [Anaerolineae bacterium]|nr:hypothetical protein [Anaerolineae bacterium]